MPCERGVAAGRRRAAPSRCRGRACRPRRRSAGSACAISPSRSSMSKAASAAIRASTFAAPWKWRELAAPPRPRGARLFARSSRPDRGRSAGRGRRPRRRCRGAAPAASRSSARNADRAAAKPLTTTSRSSRSGASSASARPMHAAGGMADQGRALDAEPVHQRERCRRAMSSTVSRSGSARSLRPVPR